MPVENFETADASFYFYNTSSHIDFSRCNAEHLCQPSHTLRLSYIGNYQDIDGASLPHLKAGQQIQIETKVTKSSFNSDQSKISSVFVKLASLYFLRIFLLL